MAPQRGSDEYSVQIRSIQRQSEMHFAELLLDSADESVHSFLSVGLQYLQVLYYYHWSKARLDLQLFHLCRQPYRAGDVLLLTSKSYDSDEVQTLVLVENVERGGVKRDQQVIQALMQMAPKDNGNLPSLALQAEAQTSQ